MEKKNLSILTMGIVGGLLIGIFLGFYFGKIRGFDQGAIKGRAEIEAKYQEKFAKHFPLFEEPREVFSHGGRIVEIEGRVIVLETTLPIRFPWDVSQTKEKRVIVTEKTEILRTVTKQVDDMIVPAGLESIEFADLKVGSFIEATTEENIKQLTEFEAIRIMVW